MRLRRQRGGVGKSDVGLARRILCFDDNSSWRELKGRARPRRDNPQSFVMATKDTRYRAEIMSQGTPSSRHDWMRNYTRRWWARRKHLARVSNGDRNIR